MIYLYSVAEINAACGAYARGESDSAVFCDIKPVEKVRVYEAHPTLKGAYEVRTDMGWDIPFGVYLERA